MYLGLKNKIKWKREREFKRQGTSTSTCNYIGLYGILLQGGNKFPFLNRFFSIFVSKNKFKKR